MKYYLLIFSSLIIIGKTSAQNQWQFSIASGVISPEFLINSPLGYQVEGRIFYLLSDSVQLSISSGFNSWKEELGPDGNKFESIPLLAGIKYSFQMGFLSPYLAGELGVHFITRDYTYQIYEPSENYDGLYKLVSSEPETESTTKFAYRLSIGSIISAYENIDLDLSIRYNNISYDFIYNFYPTNQRRTGKLFFYNIALGFIYKL
ncbi:MAG: hypothetical protein AB1521_09885 [Bacteroidota bacterium]